MSSSLEGSITRHSCPNNHRKLRSSSSCHPERLLASFLFFPLLSPSLDSPLSLTLTHSHTHTHTHSHHRLHTQAHTQTHTQTHTHTHTALKYLHMHPNPKCDHTYTHTPTCMTFGFDVRRKMERHTLEREHERET